ncbi:hypothetical protein C8Q73DRAFT_669605 [Cubamyces lactineus]|nr:hypothetical protein C8Q73DRAFT_669605 [Cubamyces lactineus]
MPDLIGEESVFGGLTSSDEETGTEPGLSTNAQVDVPPDQTLTSHDIDDGCWERSVRQDTSSAPQSGGGVVAAANEEEWEQAGRNLSTSVIPIPRPQGLSGLDTSSLEPDFEWRSYNDLASPTSAEHAVYAGDSTTRSEIICNRYPAYSGAETGGGSTCYLCCGLASTSYPAAYYNPRSTKHTGANGATKQAGASVHDHLSSPQASRSARVATRASTTTSPPRSMAPKRSRSQSDHPGEEDPVLTRRIAASKRVRPGYGVESAPPRRNARALRRSCNPPIRTDLVFVTMEDVPSGFPDLDGLVNEEVNVQVEVTANVCRISDDSTGGPREQEREATPLDPTSEVDVACSSADMSIDEHQIVRERSLGYLSTDRTNEAESDNTCTPCSSSSIPGVHAVHETDESAVAGEHENEQDESAGDVPMYGLEILARVAAEQEMQTLGSESTSKRCLTNDTFHATYSQSLSEAIASSNGEDISCGSVTVDVPEAAQASVITGSAELPDITVEPSAAPSTSACCAAELSSIRSMLAHLSQRMSANAIGPESFEAPASVAQRDLASGVPHAMGHGPRTIMSNILISDVAFRDREDEQAHFDAAQARLDVLSDFHKQLGSALEILRSVHVSLGDEVGELENYVRGLAPMPPSLEALDCSKSPSPNQQALDSRKAHGPSINRSSTPSGRRFAKLWKGKVKISRRYDCPLNRGEYWMTFRDDLEILNQF